MYFNTVYLLGENETYTFDLDDLSNDFHPNDFHLFFKLPNAKQEDCASLVSITNVVVQYAKKHVEA